MSKVLILYGSQTGETQEIAKYIAQGLQDTGHEAYTVNAANIKEETDLLGYDAYIFGSPVYNNEMMQSMKRVLWMANRLDFKDKPAAAFGSFGWSGEVPDRIHEAMQNILRMKMLLPPLKLKSPLMGPGEQEAKEYGIKLGQKLNSLS